MTNLQITKRFFHRITLFLHIPYKVKFQFLKYFFKSNSQISQDLLALSFTNFKQQGFFVEFGACNGIYLSNTFLLEKEFFWNGILAEPGKIWINELQKNRNAIIDTRCVWSKSNELLEFIESFDPGLSTINLFDNDSNFGELSKMKNTYLVPTITLQELLDIHNAPDFIDFLSIDTEGSEYEILSNFNFGKYKFKIICIEHNYNNNREKIHILLKNQGYIRIFKYFSRFDDWYLNIK